MITRDFEVTPEPGSPGWGRPDTGLDPAQPITSEKNVSKPVNLRIEADSSGDPAAMMSGFLLHYSNICTLGPGGNSIVLTIPIDLEYDVCCPPGKKGKMERARFSDVLTVTITAVDL